MADRGVVLMMPPKENNSTRRAEGRPRPEGIPDRKAEVRTQGRAALPANLARVNETARRGRQTRFTALMHHIDVDALRRSFHRQKKTASAGVDGITTQDYEVNLEENLKALCDRVHSGRYRPQPVRRTYIPKADGGQRPLGVPTLEDKIVQSAVAEMLSAIYEVDFLGFSYGFRPGRSPHQALDALKTAIMSRYVNWVLDADIRRFFDSVNHEWLLRMVAHRIADPRVLRLIRQGRTMRSWRLHLRSDKALDDLSRMFNPVLHGWINYYGSYYKSALYPILRHLDRSLTRRGP